MKVAWFTPFTKKSAIGEYSKYAAEELSKYLDVDILVFETENLYETNLHVIIYTQDNIKSIILDYDLCIYNMGNYHPFHASIFEVMKLRRGIIISHDLCLHDFFFGYYSHFVSNINMYKYSINKLYGKENAEKIFQATANVKQWASLDHSIYHMSQLLFPYCEGFFVHSKYHRFKLESLFAGPINNAWLPIPNKNESVINERSNKMKFNLLTVGYVNPNKRIRSTIETIGKNKRLCENVHFICVGSLENNEYAKELSQVICDYKLESIVKLIGYVGNDKLLAYYNDADIIINLRYPALEGGSWSLAEQMQMGKIIIVSNTGVYSEIPDNCVIKIDPNNEIEDLTNSLLDIIDNPEKFKQYGSNAKKFAEEEFSPSLYAKKLYDFIQHIVFLRPLNSLIDLIAQELRSFRVQSEISICSAISDEIESLFIVDQVK